MNPIAHDSETASSTLSFDLRKITNKEVKSLVSQYHGYKSLGSSSVYAFGVFEEEKCVAAFSWQPPPFGAAKSISPSCPFAVLALSRMVAVPKTDRKLKHISKPLKFQMKNSIDRSRWPVLVTYSDEGQGHNGFVYQCSGWDKTLKAERRFYVDSDGSRASPYANGVYGERSLKFEGKTMIQRWEHWFCEKSDIVDFMSCWIKTPVPGKVWNSGNQAYKYVKQV